MALNPRQQTFCAGVLSGLSATEAYKRAGYKGRGHSAESAAEQLLRNIEVSAYLESHRRAASERAVVTATDVLKGLKREAGYEGEGASHSARVAAWIGLGKFIDMGGGVAVESDDITTKRIDRGKRNAGTD